jgi:hypothetical protein
VATPNGESLFAFRELSMEYETYIFKIINVKKKLHQVKLVCMQELLFAVGVQLKFCGHLRPNMAKVEFQLHEETADVKRHSCWNGRSPFL